MRFMCKISTIGWGKKGLNEKIQGKKKEKEIVAVLST